MKAGSPPGPDSLDRFKKAGNLLAAVCGNIDHAAVPMSKPPCNESACQERKARRSNSKLPASRQPQAYRGFRLADDLGTACLSRFVGNGKDFYRLGQWF